MQPNRIDEQLVTALYDTALYSDDWQPALERFRVLLNSAEAALPVWPQCSLDAGQVHTSGHLLTPEVREPYFRYYGRIDPKLNVLYGSQTGYLFNDSRHFDDAFVARNPFYQEYTNWLGMRHTLDMTIQRRNGSEAFLAVMRGSSQGRYDARAEQLFRQAADHFVRVLKLKEKLDGANHLGLLAGDALNRLRLGIILIGADGRVVLSNRAAEDACGPGEDLYLRNGHLSARSAKLAQQIEESVRRALDTPCAATSFRVARARGGDRGVWIARLAADRSPIAQSSAVVVIGEAQQTSGNRADDLTALYGLTRAEAQIAALIGSGLSLTEAATKRGVKISTARSQLLAVFQKTGARGQADLLRLLSSLPGAAMRR